MRRNLIFGIFGAIYGTGLFILAFGAAGSIALDPRNPSSHMRLGNALAGKGDYDGAIAECRRAIALEPHQPGAHNDLGYALMRKGDYKS
jgi:Flp pilus assembly protein TadD